MKKFVYRMIVLMSIIMQSVICCGLVYYGKWYVVALVVAFLPIIIITGLVKMKEEPKEDMLYWFFTPLSLYLMSKGTSSEWLYNTALLNYCFTAIIYICFVIAAMRAKKKAKK